MQNDFVQRIALGEYETRAARKVLIADGRRMGITRVMLINTYGHIEPGHLDLDETRRRAAVMTEASRDFRAVGLGVGINIHVTLGMNMSPPRTEPLPCQHKVDFDGVIYRETYCPFDTQFQAYLAETYAIYAGVEGIDDIWIDDDYRYKTKAGQCFCPLHLAEFTRLTGRAWTREKVVAALPSNSLTPTALAVQWGEVQNQGLIAGARAIADAVHRVAPAVRIGFMPPKVDVSYYGGACVTEIGHILNPGTRGLARPEYGSYSDVDRVSWNAYLPTWSMHRAFGDTYDGWPELETWPGTGYNHSARVVQMKLAWGALHGFVSTTLSGARRDRPVLRAVADAKAQIAEITPFVTAPDNWQPRGISLEMSENTLGLRTKVDVLTVEVFAARLLARSGLPLWPDGGGGRILVGNAPLTRQEELTAFACDGMLLDRDAFAVLEAMGRDDILGGARLAQRPGYPAAEQFAALAQNGLFAGETDSLEAFSPVRNNLPVYQLPASPEFTTLGWLHDQNRQPLGVGSWTRHWAGGKIVVLPFSFNEPGVEQGFLTARRVSQLAALLTWLTGRELPVRLEGAAYDLQVVYRQHRAGHRVFLGLANFGLDDATDFTVVVPALAGATTTHIRVLDNRGKWQYVIRPVGEGGRLVFRGLLTVPDQQVRAYEIIGR